MAQPKISKPQSKTHTLKIIAIVAAFVMGGLMLYMNAMINTNIINYKITNDEESRQLLKDFYDIDYKKD